MPADLIVLEKDKVAFTEETGVNIDMIRNSIVYQEIG
jgi:hypothetical protein